MGVLRGGGLCASVFCRFMTVRQCGKPRAKGRGSWKSGVSRKEEVIRLELQVCALQNCGRVTVV